MRSRPEISLPSTVTRVRSSRMIQVIVSSSRMRIAMARPRPMIRARCRRASCRRPTRIEMKMMLSTPRTISSAVSVASATHASGELIHSMRSLSVRSGCASYHDEWDGPARGDGPVQAAACTGKRLPGESVAVAGQCRLVSRELFLVARALVDQKLDAGFQPTGLLRQLLEVGEQQHAFFGRRVPRHEQRLLLADRLARLRELVLLLLQARVHGAHVGAQPEQLRTGAIRVEEAGLEVRRANAMVLAAGRARVEAASGLAEMREPGLATGLVGDEVRHVAVPGAGLAVIAQALGRIAARAVLEADGVPVAQCAFFLAERRAAGSDGGKHGDEHPGRQRSSFHPLSCATFPDDTRR